MLSPASQKLFLASRQGYFPDTKQIDSICFQIFQGDYTLVFPINSLPEAHKERRARRERRNGLKIERRLEIYSLASKNTENYFSNPTRINLGC